MPTCSMADLLCAALTALIPCGALCYHVRLTSRFISSIHTRHPWALEMLAAHGASLPHRWMAGDDEMGRPYWSHRRLAVLSHTARCALGTPPEYGGQGCR